MVKDGSTEVLSDGAKVRMDESEARTWRPDIFQVRGTSEEISILFGSLLERVSQKEALASDQGRIIMRPSTAKRLVYHLGAYLLGLKESEEAPGPGGRLPADTKGKPDLSRILSADARDDTSRRVDLLLNMIHDLGTTGGFERSFKISEKTLLFNRFLIGVNKKELGGDGDARILDICQETGMPKSFLRDLGEKLREVNFVLFGFEENEKSCVHKVYLEYYDLYPKALEKGHGKEEPFLLHRGYKWDAGNKRKKAVTHYMWHPGISAAGVHKRISALHDGCNSNLSGEAMGRILDTAAGRVDPERFICLEVTEEKNPRKSMDINVYDAGLRLRELDGILEKVCRGFSVPPEGFQEHFGKIQDGILGHVGGGVDRTGRDFVTIYFEPQGP